VSIARNAWPDADQAQLAPLLSLLWWLLLWWLLLWWLLLWWLLLWQWLLLWPPWLFEPPQESL
jgi:hypothetical protein